MVHSPNLEIVTAGFPRRYNGVPEISPRYFMLHLVPSTAMTGAWSLTLRDSSFHVLEVLGPEDFTGSNAAGRWTGRLPAKEIVFDLHAAPGAAGVKFTLDEAIIMAKDAINPRYSWQGPNAHYDSLYKYTASPDEKNRVLRLGDRVGFLIGSGPAPQGLVSWCCSGVMLTGDLFLTNWHCGGPTGVPATGVWHQERCATTLIDLSWDVQLHKGCRQERAVGLRASARRACDKYLAEHRHGPSADGFWSVRRHQRRFADGSSCRV
jgi:hypothetical protein